MTAINIPRDLREPDVSKAQRAESRGWVIPVADKFMQFGFAGAMLLSLLMAGWWWGSYVEIPDRERRSAREDKRAEAEISSMNAHIASMTSNAAALTKIVSLFTEVVREQGREDAELLRGIARDLKEIKDR